MSTACTRIGKWSLWVNLMSLEYFCYVTCCRLVLFVCQIPLSESTVSLETAGEENKSLLWKSERAFSRSIDFAIDFLPLNCTRTARTVNPRVKRKRERQLKRWLGHRMHCIFGAPAVGCERVVFENIVASLATPSSSVLVNCVSSLRMHSSFAFCSRFLPVRVPFADFSTCAGPSLSAAVENTTQNRTYTHRHTNHPHWATRTSEPSTREDQRDIDTSLHPSLSLPHLTPEKRQCSMFSERHSSDL